MVKIWQSFYGITKIEKPKFPREYPLPTLTKLIGEVYRWMWKNSSNISRDDDDDSPVKINYNEVQTFLVRLAL